MLLLLAAAILLASTPAESQVGQLAMMDTLSAYVGQEVLVVDTTSGQEQFHHSDATLVYRLTLRDVRSEFILVSRNVEADKRYFLYPLRVVRRITTIMNGRPVRPIVLEMY
jgi:hypothetical protein